MNEPAIQDWLEDLRGILRVAGDGYQRVQGKDDDAEEHPRFHGIRANRTSFALMAVAAVTAKLAELAGMADHVGLVPLHDLTAALWDLGRGQQPALLRPVAGIGKGREYIAGRWVRQHALLCVAILEDAGLKGRPASRIVAKCLAEQGFTGRKSKGQLPLSEGSVVGWRNDSRQHDAARRDPETRAFLQRNLARYRRIRGWPLDEGLTVGIVRDLLSSPLIRSKSD